MSNKIKIELTPYQAICIWKFMMDFEHEFKTVPQLASLYEIYNEYGQQVAQQLNDETMHEAILDCEIQQLLGRDPLSKKNKDDTIPGA